MTASTTDQQERGSGIEDRVKTIAPHQSLLSISDPQSSIPDPESPILLHATSEDHHIARMAAFALGLSVLEAAIPSPLPGVKPGLANIITLIVLARYGWCTAAWVSILRVLAGGLVMGNFLSPGFFLGLSGAIFSLAILALCQQLPSRWFGPVTHSILAAYAHIAGQLLLVYFWLIPHAGLAYLLPIFALAALIFGTVNGLIAARFIQAPQPQGDATYENNY
jgi:heptaprenyl diphosphate synthase